MSKNKDVNPFTRDFNVSQCDTDSYAGWNWRAEKRVSVDVVY